MKKNSEVQTLLAFCHNLETYVAKSSPIKEDKNLRTIAKGLSVVVPMTIGERLRKAIDANLISSRYLANIELIWDAIKIRNDFVHGNPVPKLTKYLVAELKNKLGDLCVNDQRIQMEQVDLVNNVYLKAVDYLKERYNPKSETLGKIVIELYNNADFKKVRDRFWSFERLRNKFYHVLPSLSEKEARQVASFGKFIENMKTS